MMKKWIGTAARAALVAAVAIGTTAAIGKNDQGRDRDDDDKRDRDRRECPDGRELTLTNGRIHLLDAAGSVVSSVTIRNGRFAAVGPDSGGGSGTPGCRQFVNLDGRTALPGLVDNHNHIVLLGLRPGWHTPIETATSFADIGATYRRRIAGAPAGAFITSIGGFNPVQFAEKRLPNLAELDAIAPANPVYLQVSFTGPATTNTLGRAFFQGRGIAVGADGSIAANAPTVAALNALRSIQTFADKKRGTLDALAYSASLGVTTNFDMGGFLIPGSPDHEDEFTFDGAASWDPYTAYDPMLDVYREGRMAARVRIFFLSMDNAQATPILSRRLNNAFREFGDDWMRVAGLGEFITNWPLFGAVTPPSNYPAAVRKAAERGWIYSAAGPPYRMIVDSGIKVGAGSDSAQISALNPWLMLYYMTTGKNSSGVLINAGQTLTRQEALRLYTVENGWFSKEEDKLGSIEPGKLGDVVVLNGDYFSVPDESLKSLRSVLTVVGGKIVHDEGVLRVHDR